MHELKYGTTPPPESKHDDPSSMNNARKISHHDMDATVRFLYMCGGFTSTVSMGTSSSQLRSDGDPPTPSTNTHATTKANVRILPMLYNAAEPVNGSYGFVDVISIKIVH